MTSAAPNLGMPNLDMTEGPSPPRRPSWRAVVTTVFGGATGSIAITLVTVLVVALLWVGTEFYSTANLTIIGAAVTVPLLIGTCSGFALLAGVVDLSIGSCAGVCAAIFAYLTVHHWGGWQAGGIVLLAGLVIGSVNAVTIVGFGANPLAATLGMLTGLLGLQYVITGQDGLITSLLPGLYTFSNRQLGPLPLIFVLVLVVVGMAYYIVAFSRLGRHIRAVGGDEMAAGRAGIRVKRIQAGALLLSSLGASVAGLIYIGQQGGASNTLGTDITFQVYAALMIGGYSIIRGGVGNPLGGAMGLLVIAGVTEIISVKAINTYYTDVVIGALLLAAVFLDRLRGGDKFE
jgi:ribose/xylose/arabinose/galactoside ABC-type transport system permease subunit